HPLEKQVTSDRISLFVFENPIRRLLMPNQRVAYHDHAMPLTKLDIAIGGSEVENIGLRMYECPLQHVFWRNGVELCLGKFLFQCEIYRYFGVIVGQYSRSAVH